MVQKDCINMSEISYETLTAYAVRNADGKVDFDSTIKKFSTRLVEFEAAVEKEEGAIASAVTDTFDKLLADEATKGMNQNMDTIVFLAVQALAPNAGNYKILSDRIKNWLRINSDQPKKMSEDGKTVLVEAEKPRTRMFGIFKGKGGGVKRWSDFPETAVKPEE
jgi:hypothetical protein